MSDGECDQARSAWPRGTASRIADELDVELTETGAHLRITGDVDATQANINRRTEDRAIGDERVVFSALAAGIDAACLEGGDQVFGESGRPSQSGSAVASVASSVQVRMAV